MGTMNQGQKVRYVCRRTNSAKGIDPIKTMTPRPFALSYGLNPVSVWKGMVSLVLILRFGPIRRNITPLRRCPSPLNCTRRSLGKWITGRAVHKFCLRRLEGTESALVQQYVQEDDGWANLQLRPPLRSRLSGYGLPGHGRIRELS